MKTIRVAAHVHSEWSYDAEWPLPELVGAFRERGYDAVLMAEHDRGFDDARWEAYRAACAEASTPELLLVPGMEYEDSDAFTVFAHPARRDAIRSFQPEWAPLLDAVEIWNRHYDGIAPYPRGRSFAAEQGLRPFAALDFHTRRQFFPLALALEVAEPVSAAAVVEALRAARFRVEAFGTSALRFTGGIPGTALRTGEWLRRRIRGPVRRAQRLAGRGD